MGLMQSPYFKKSEGTLQKLQISNIINEWKNSDGVEYTRGGNPKPPANEVIQTWILDAWKGINNSNIENSIKAAGFNEDPSKWHIYKHDVYGERFWVAWECTGEIEANAEDFEQYPQENDIEDIFDE